jgi:hypothetical protein
MKAILLLGFALISTISLAQNGPKIVFTATIIQLILEK